MSNLNRSKNHFDSLLNLKPLTGFWFSGFLCRTPWQRSGWPRCFPIATAILRFLPSLSWTRLCPHSSVTPLPWIRMFPLWSDALLSSPSDAASWTARKCLTWRSWWKDDRPSATGFCSCPRLKGPSTFWFWITNMTCSDPVLGNLSLFLVPSDSPDEGNW